MLHMCGVCMNKKMQLAAKEDKVTELDHARWSPRDSYYGNQKAAIWAYAEGIPSRENDQSIPFYKCQSDIEQYTSLLLQSGFAGLPDFHYFFLLSESTAST
jgi:hypothetical protein